MRYEPRHFDIRELVSPCVYRRRGSKAIQLLNPQALASLDLLRDKFGPATVNNWHLGGSRSWSGLRTPDSPYFSLTSQHTYGRAFDVLFRDASAKEVRRYICANPDDFPHISFLECDISWVHFDVRNSDGLTLWSPTKGFLEDISDED